MKDLSASWGSEHGLCVRRQDGKSDDCTAVMRRWEKALLLETSAATFRGEGSLYVNGPATGKYREREQIHIV